jgi:transcriptional regulator with XRE-family HTH domain
MSQEELLINGDLLRLRREARGWVLNDMATRACMSVKQIRQLEEGGTSAFYSAAVKFTAAKKVGALLGLSADEVFAQEAAATPVAEAVESDVLVESTNEVSPIEAVPVALVTVDTDVQSNVQEPVATEVLTEAPKSKTSLWVIAGLFAAALAVAAYLQPQDEQAPEPAPPLQVIPSEATESASAASATEAPASAVDTTASAPRIAAMPVASSVAPVVRAASNAGVVQPAASAITKAP